MSEETLNLKPKFLTEAMVKIAIGTAIYTILDPTVHPDAFDQSNLELKRLLQPKRNQCHVVVLLPGRKEFRPCDQEADPLPVLRYEGTHFGHATELEGPYVEIARSKATQLWYDRNDDRTDIQPHLLFPGDAPYWGGVKRRGIVVACSGVQPHLDKLISGMIADILVAMAYSAWKASSDYKNEVAFLE